MEILMVLTNIILISFILFLPILVIPLVKKALHKRRYERLLRKYIEDYRKREKSISKESAAHLENVVSLEEYREKRYGKIL